MKAEVEAEGVYDDASEDTSGNVETQGLRTAGEDNRNTTKGKKEKKRKEKKMKKRKEKKSRKEKKHNNVVSMT